MEKGEPLLAPFDKAANPGGLDGAAKGCRLEKREPLLAPFEGTALTGGEDPLELARLAESVDGRAIS